MNGHLSAQRRVPRIAAVWDFLLERLGSYQPPAAQNRALGQPDQGAAHGVEPIGRCLIVGVRVGRYGPGVASRAMW